MSSPKMKFGATVSVLFFCGIFTVIYASNFYVAAPKLLRLNAEETIVIAMDGANATLVNVNVEDHPQKTKIITSRQVALQPDKPKVFTIRLDPNDFPPNFFKTPGQLKYVSLTADFAAFKKEIVIPVTSQSGYMFIQTDKPIYTPRQRVLFRIIPVSEEIRESKEPFQLVIKNPQNITIDEKNFNEKHQELNSSFVSHVHTFPSKPILGEWSATVRFGHNMERNSTIHFMVKEYVVPTFTVNLTTPDVILPTDKEIIIKVSVKNVYGKSVQGVVNFRLGVRKPNSLTADVFGEVRGQEVDDEGTHTLRLQTEEIKKVPRIGCFPKIEGSYLYVEATVVDDATGNSETATNVKGRFSTTPFVISFDRCVSDFKPGLISVFEADITYVGGNPASGISTRIRAVGNDGKKLQIAHDTAISDDNGKVTFEIQPELQHSKVTITLETIDEKFKDIQAKKTFEQYSYKSTTNAYLAISRSSPQILKPGDIFGREIYFQPPRMKDIYYMVIAKGKILDVNKLPRRTQRIDFQISYDMVPSFRLLAFAHYENELIVDSLKIDVESICHPNAQVSISTDYKVKEPAHNGSIVIHGKKGTTVGVLGVDEATYALSRRDLLTKAKLFNTLGSHDLGCGPGGGLTTDSVLGNAGITMGTNQYTPSNSVHSCTGRIRKKRNIPEEDVAEYIAAQYEGVERECCLLIREPNEFNRTCEEIADIIDNRLKERLPSCAKVFMECCWAVEDEIGINDLCYRFGCEIPFFTLNPKQQEDMIKDLTVWSDFRETWLFQDFVIGSEDKVEVSTTLPHSITTWVLQAVALSPENGMCVAEPKRIESFKQIFIHLNFPYSVVRNEQVEIQATVFNYGTEKIYAYVYMFGTADLCLGSQPGERGETKVLVESQSAATVTFPVIPMEVKDYPIKVAAMTVKGSDAIERTLHVVPEGITKEIDITIKLDPTNIQRRKKRYIISEYFTDEIDPIQNIQVTSIKLGTPEGFVPGTDSCYITAMGNTFGPAVETSVKNPQGLIKLPGGCGEQNMVGLAPTLYAMNYLKASDKLTANIEETGYEYIRKGYSNELHFRKDDGSYSTFKGSESSTWLTAFVIKVFCQVTKLVVIDRNVLCSGVKWLIDHQEADGSYIEKKALWHKEMVGGVNGEVPLTAFILITLSECDCDENNYLMLAKQRAVSYLEAHINKIGTPLPAAIVSYALALVNSDMKNIAIEKLLALATYDEDTNRLYWQTPGSAQDIETAGYALMALLLSKDMVRSNSIVNWLNTKQLQSGAFKSTQDTVVALQALSKFAIEDTTPVNLVSNITSSNDMNFHQVLTFNDDNALMLQDVRVDKMGGTIFIKTSGQGQGILTAKLRYNVIVPTEDICRFEVKVDVSEVKDFVPVKGARRAPKDLQTSAIPDIYKLKDDMRKPPPGVDRVEAEAEEEPLNRRVKRQNPDGKAEFALNITLCVRYLGNKESGMSIVDVGTFSGFEPHTRDLEKLEDDENHLIKLYETSSRSVVFYLEKVPTNKKYCFNYHVLRKFYIGNIQMSAIKVYDYYNPDEACTIFFRPDNGSAMLQTICEDDKQCDCAEGGCPPEKPFSKYMERDTAKTREKMIEAFCEIYDFLWKGRVKEQKKPGNGFINITFEIDEIVKPGIENIKGETRTLLMRDTCKEPLFVGSTYLIAGKDGKAYQNEREIWYRYMLDKTSAVYLYGINAEDRKLQRHLEYVTKDLSVKGCDFYI